LISSIQECDPPTRYVTGSAFGAFSSYGVVTMRNDRALISAGLLFICWLAASSPGLAQPRPVCHRAPQWIETRDDLIREINALSNARTFQQQFAEVKQTLDVLHETLQSTSGDLQQTRDRIRQLFGTVETQNREMQNVRRWARSIYSNPDWEPTASSESTTLSLDDGLGTSIRWIDDLEKETGRFSDALDILEIAVNASDQSPADQLEAFAKYFDSINEVIEPYAKAVPQLRFLVEALSYYGEAVGLIANAVRSIQNSNARKDEMLRQLGPAFKNVRYNRVPESASERQARQLRELESQLAQVERQLEECGIDPESPSDQEPTSDIVTEIQRARSAADRRCSANFDGSDENQIVDARNAALERLRTFYPTPSYPYYPAKYGDSLTASEELDYAQLRHARRTEEDNQAVLRLEAEIDELTISTAATEERFQRFRRGELRLPLEEQIALNDARLEGARELEFKQSQLDRIVKRIRERDEAFMAAMDADSDLGEYRLCLREWIEGLSEQLDWDPFWLSYVHPDLYHATLVTRSVPEVVQECSVNGMNVGDSRSCVCGDSESIGSVWGSSVYTSDSDICLAAVHSGLVEFDALVGSSEKVVNFTLIGGCPYYDGGSRNGIESKSWGEYASSFFFPDVQDGLCDPTSSPQTGLDYCPITLGSNDSMTCHCTPRATQIGGLWGTGVYTGDSGICKAARHNGSVGPRGGTITVVRMPGASSYTGSTRNGVESSDWGSYSVSFGFR
jgi:hypothetical protein